MTIPAETVSGRNKLASLVEENVEKLLTCVHCGLCLPACPTYRVLGNENDSPRGRVYLMRGLAEGKLGVGDTFISHIDLCLGCRACETACPSGVPYGQLLETARAEVAEAKAKSHSALALVVRFVLNQVFTRPRLLGACLLLARWVRDSGLARLVFQSHAVDGRSRFALALLLASRSPLKESGLRRSVEKPTPLQGEAARMKVALLRGCVMEGLFGEANRATERMLERSGCELVEAKEQTCCGALHCHAGEIETARRLAGKNIEAFLATGCERIIVNAAGCGAAMKEYPTLLAQDPDFSERARQVASMVRDVSEFLVEHGFKQPRGFDQRRIAYDAPCHLMHAQRVTQPPLDLLKSIHGATVATLSGYESCCGGAGIYNLQNPALSWEILLDKLSAIRASGADTVASGNPGCIMQIGAGILIEGLNVDVLHPIELLDAACDEG